MCDFSEGKIASLEARECERSGMFQLLLLPITVSPNTRIDYECRRITYPYDPPGAVCIFSIYLLASPSKLATGERSRAYLCVFIPHQNWCWIFFLPTGINFIPIIWFCFCIRYEYKIFDIRLSMFFFRRLAYQYFGHRPALRSF